MWIAIVCMALVLGMAPFWLGVLPPMGTRCLLRFNGTGCRVSGDSLPPRVVNAASDLLQQAGVKRGFIAIQPNRRVKFSFQIPKTLHQRLRNVLLNP